MIGVVINFCSNDYPFLRHCINGVKPFAAKIIVPVCDHFFDGYPESLQTLNAIYAEHSDVTFIEYPYQHTHSPYHWHNLSRLIGSYSLNTDHILFLDADEIIDSEKFECPSLPARLANYWYFREPIYRAKTWEATPLILPKECLSSDLLMDPRERAGMFHHLPGEKHENFLSAEGMPMVHHYSWVRTKDQLLRKVSSWGHNRDRDWISLVNEEFSRPFNGTDFVHGYTYDIVQPYITLDLSKQPQLIEQKFFPHVQRLSPSELLKIDLSFSFGLNFT